MKKRWAMLALVLALMSGAAPGRALASWCGTAARFGGECSVCNGMCLMEAWFESLGGW